MKLRAPGEADPPEPAVRGLGLVRPCDETAVRRDANRAPRGQVELEPGQRRGRSLEIEVQDNGAGFTAEAAQKATEPFWTTRNVGVGLGLTVTRKIVELHHGKLEIVPPQEVNAYTDSATNARYLRLRAGKGPLRVVCEAEIELAHHDYETRARRLLT